jgi:hypothetical protein
MIVASNWALKFLHVSPLILNNSLMSQSPAPSLHGHKNRPHPGLPAVHEQHRHYCCPPAKFEFKKPVRLLGFTLGWVGRSIWFTRLQRVILHRSYCVPTPLLSNMRRKAFIITVRCTSASLKPACRSNVHVVDD